MLTCFFYTFFSCINNVWSFDKKDFESLIRCIIINRTFRKGHTLAVFSFNLFSSSFFLVFHSVCVRERERVSLSICYQSHPFDTYSYVSSSIYSLSLPACLVDPNLKNIENPDYTAKNGGKICQWLIRYRQWRMVRFSKVQTDIRSWIVNRRHSSPDMASWQNLGYGFQSYLQQTKSC